MLDVVENARMHKLNTTQKKQATRNTAKQKYLGLWLPFTTLGHETSAPDPCRRGKWRRSVASTVRDGLIWPLLRLVYTVDHLSK